MFGISRRRWRTDPDKIRGLLFPRSTDMLDFLDGLVRRTRLFFRKEKTLPIVCFYRVWPNESPMKGVEDRLRGQTRVAISKVTEPASKAPCTDDSDDPKQRFTKIASLRTLLDQIVRDFSGDFPHVRRLHFPHYALACWLLFLAEKGFEKPSEQKTTHQPDRIHKKLERAFKRFIEERYEIAQRSAALPNLADDVPSWIRWPLATMPPLGLLLMRLFWHPPKWFRKRQIGANKPGSFTGLACKFAEWKESGLSSADISALLVDSFLQDLRRAYRRTSLLGAGRRRTTHLVLLLEPSDGGAVAREFLQRVGDQRNRRSTRRWSRRSKDRWDPLLIITQGDDRTLEQLGPVRRPADWPYGAADADYAYDRWLDKLDEAGTAERSWLLPLRLPAKPEKEPDGALGDLFRKRITVSVPVLLPIVTVVVLLAGIMVGYSHYYDSCKAFPWEPYMKRMNRMDGTKECVGLFLPSSSSQLFGDRVKISYIDKKLAEDLIGVEKLIANNNDRIEQRQGNGRFSTVVYLGSLTPVDPLVYDEQLEQLRGLAVAQQQSLNDDLPIRVMLANAGDKLGNHMVATEAIKRADNQDGNRIVGVTGFGISLTVTLDAASALGDNRIPTLGNSLSATDLARRTSQYYHQVSPTNDREAAVVGIYIKEVLKAEKALIYWSSDDNDLYSKDLFAQAQNYFQRAGITSSDRRYKVSEKSPGEDVHSLGRTACTVGDNGVVFYAGRSDKLRALLDGMSSQCAGKYPKIVLGDDARSFSLKRTLPEFRGLVVDYVSFASSLTWGQDCAVAANEVRFYQTYLGIFKDCSTTADGEAALSYDAALLFMEAVKRAQGNNANPPSADLVLGKINEMRNEDSVIGASGTIGYSKDYGNGRIPVNKAVLVLRASSNSDATLRLVCGQLDYTLIANPGPPCPDDLFR